MFFKSLREADDALQAQKCLMAFVEEGTGHRIYLHSLVPAGVFDRLVKGGGKNTPGSIPGLRSVFVPSTVDPEELIKTAQK